MTSRNSQVGAPTGTVGTGPKIRVSKGYAGFVLPGVPESASAARDAARRVLSRPGNQTDNAVTCVSELATNAILHTRSGQAGGQFAVTLEMLPDWSIVVSVLDEGARTAPGPVRPGGESGRGLAIVEILSDDWGIVPMYGPGRLTWCLLKPMRPHLRAASRDASPARRDTAHDAPRDGVLDTARDAVAGGRS